MSSCNSCGVVEWPLWTGLFFPMAVIYIIHITLLLGSIITHRKHSVSQKDNCTCSRYNSKRLRNNLILTLTSCTCYGGWIFGLISVNPRQSQHSESFQAIFTILTSVQGVLMFTYIIYTYSYTQIFWTLKISRFKLSLTINNCNDLNTTPTNEVDGNSTSMPSHATLTTVEESRRGNTIIPTETNPSYKTVILRQNKDKCIMTENAAYGQLTY